MLREIKEEYPLGTKTTLSFLLLNTLSSLLLLVTGWPDVAPRNRQLIVF